MGNYLDEIFKEQITGSVHPNAPDANWAAFETQMASGSAANSGGIFQSIWQSVASLGAAASVSIALFSADAPKTLERDLAIDNATIFSSRTLLADLGPKQQNQNVVPFLSEEKSQEDNNIQEANFVSFVTNKEFTKAGVLDEIPAIASATSTQATEAEFYSTAETTASISSENGSKESQPAGTEEILLTRATANQDIEIDFSGKAELPNNLEWIERLDNQQMTQVRSVTNADDQNELAFNADPKLIPTLGFSPKTDPTLALPSMETSQSSNPLRKLLIAAEGGALGTRAFTNISGEKGKVLLNAFAGLSIAYPIKERFTIGAGAEFYTRRGHVMEFQQTDEEFLFDRTFITQTTRVLKSEHLRIPVFATARLGTMHYLRGGATAEFLVNTVAEREIKKENSELITNEREDRARGFVEGWNKFNLGAQLEYEIRPIEHVGVFARISQQFGDATNNDFYSNQTTADRSRDIQIGVRFQLR